jgi:hypothetical protein
MRIEENHSFTPDEAQQRLKILVDGWQKKYGVSATWSGNAVQVNGKAMGVTIDAKVTVEAGKIVADGKDPGLLLRGAAVGYLKKKFAEYFDPKTSVSDLASRQS